MLTRSIIILTAALLSITPFALATPRLAASYGQDCHLCHANPTGGGLRSSFVTSYIGPSEITMAPLPAHEKTRWPNPKITDQITIGTDLRFLYLGTNDVSTGSGTLDNTFFQMQGDVYLAFEPAPEFLIYLDKGLGSGYEIFVVARVLPFHGYLKAGQFVPDIGWRWDDHTRYTREKLGLDFPGATDAGVELGLRPGQCVISLALMNGTEGSTLDNNAAKAVVGRILHRGHLGKLQWALGGTGRFNHAPTFHERLYGLLGQGSLGRLAYTGDFYWRRIAPDGGARAWSWLFSQELDLKIRQGVDLFVGYDFFDPNLDFESGTQNQLTVGARLYLRHFLKLEPVYRYEDGEVTLDRTTNSRFEILLHAYY